MEGSVGSRNYMTNINKLNNKMHGPCQQEDEEVATWRRRMHKTQCPWTQKAEGQTHTNTHALGLYQTVVKA